MKTILKPESVIHPELSYKIIGCAFEVYNQIGPGFQEKIYQRALREAFNLKELKFKEQVFYDIKFNKTRVGRGFMDFLVDEKIVVEIKRGNFFSKTDIDQVIQYLKMSNLELGILIRFTDEAVRYKRILNIIK
ncbi:MAG TPA: GxxExxY protein [Bacteroidia bacterium]|nr:GxxExxY protein [Bacteroidia bacterium]